MKRLFAAVICFAVITLTGTGINAYPVVFSTTTDAQIGDLLFKDGDLIQYDLDTGAAFKILDESIFNDDEDIDAVSILVNGNFVFSITTSGQIGDLKFKDEDLIEFSTETGLASMFFDMGSIMASSEDISAVSVLANGNIILSTTTAAEINGIMFEDGDLVEYDPVTGIASIIFDESVFAGDEDIDAISVLDNGNIILSTTTSANIGGLSFKDGDIVEYILSTGDAYKIFDESVFASSEDIDAVAVFNTSHPVPEPGTIILSMLGFSCLACLRKNRC